MKRLAKIWLSCALLATLGGVAAVAIAGGSATTGTATACATASVPAQTISANNSQVGIIAGASSTHCETVTYTIPTITTTVASTTPATTTTAPTTTTTLGPATLVSSSPADGATISGIVNWTIQTSGDVASVEFWSDNVKLGTDTSAPWSYQLDTTKQTDGPHRYGLALIQSDGTRVTPQVGTFTVANGTTAATTTTAPTTTTAAVTGSVDNTINFETGDFSQTTGLECPSASKDASVVTSPVRKGNYAARLHIDSTSALWGNGIPRCLFTGYTPTQKNGDEFYYGFSFMVPKAQSEMVWELHQPASIYNISGCDVAPFMIYTGGSSHGTYLRIFTGDCTSKMANYATGWPEQESLPLPDLQPEPYNTWIDVVVHIKFRETNDGVVEVWTRTGSNPYKLQVSKSGIPTTQFSSEYNIHDAGLYLEMGVYPGAKYWTGDDTEYLDEYRRGTSFSAVAP